MLCPSTGVECAEFDYNFSLEQLRNPFEPNAVSINKQADICLAGLQSVVEGSDEAQTSCGTKLYLRLDHREQTLALQDALELNNAS